MTPSARQQTLIRLAKCVRWSEEYRMADYVGLTGYQKNGRIVTDALSLTALTELIQSGDVEMDESQRFAPVNSDGDLGVVYQRYWKVRD
jgi:hypothetical protein